MQRRPLTANKVKLVMEEVECEVKRVTFSCPRHQYNRQCIGV